MGRVASAPRPQTVLQSKGLGMGYPITFRTYIERTVAYALAAVKSCPNILSDDIRKQALHAIDYGLKHHECWETVSELLLAMAPKMEWAGIRDQQWIEFLTQALTNSRTRGDERAISNFALHLGILYRLVSNYPQSEQLLAEAVSSAKQIPDKLLTAQALNEFAWVEHLQHRYAEASVHAKEALDLSGSHDTERGMSFRVLGMIALQTGELKESEELHHAALLIFQQNNDFRHSAWSLQNFALALRNQERYDEALPKLQQAVDDLQQINDLYNWTTAKMNLGATYLLNGTPQSALVHLHEAAYQATLNRDILQLANISNWLGLTYLDLKEFEEAQQSFLHAISLFTKLADDGWRLNNMDGLGMVYLEQKQFVQAQIMFESALMELHKIPSTSPRYNYLNESLNKHLREAKEGQNPTTG